MWILAAIFLFQHESMHAREFSFNCFLFIFVTISICTTDWSSVQKKRKKTKTQTQCDSIEEGKKKIVQPHLACKLILNRITKYATVWNHCNLFLFFSFSFFVAVSLVVHGSKVFLITWKFPIGKKKIRWSKNLYGGLFAFALDIIWLVALLCHGLVYFIVVIDFFFSCGYTLT